MFGGCQCVPGHDPSRSVGRCRTRLNIRDPVRSALNRSAWAAPILLVVLRVCQGLAVGGEWAGATLLTAENAPEDKRGTYALFPQLGPSLGFVLASATFLTTRQPREILLGAGAVSMCFGFYYIGVTYLTSYGTGHLGLPSVTVLAVGMAIGSTLAAAHDRRSTPVVPVVSAEVPIAEVAEAHALLDSSASVGKVLLTIGKP